MLSNGFKINECDKCVYIKDTPNQEVIVCLYVDDMLIMSKDIANIKATKCMLVSKFDMKDLGVADVILGVNILKTSNGITLSQTHYIQKVLEKFKYLNFNRSKTPIDVNLHLSKIKVKVSLNWTMSACWKVDLCHELYTTRHSLRYQ